MAESDLGKEMETLKADLAQLRSDVGMIAETLKEMGADQAERTKSKLSDVAQALVEEVRAAFDNAKGKGKSSVEAVERQIEDRPFLSILTAFGTGIILGKVLERR